MGASTAAYTTLSGSLNRRGGLSRRRSGAGGDSARTKLCGYYTFLVGVLARLSVEANFVRFLP